MPDVALIGNKNFLFEKLFEEAGVGFQFINPEVLGSPFMPKFKLLIVPTGFANTQYSKALPALRRSKSAIASFVLAGGVLLVYGPLVLLHDFDWLPLALQYNGEYSEAEDVSATDHQFSCLCSGSADCDGYLVAGEEFETVMTDSRGRSIMVVGRLGEGLIVATTIHEFPTREFICLAAKLAKPAKI